MTLVAGFLSGSSADLMLKHGHHVAGSWSVVGVLDAVPDGGAKIDEKVQSALGTALVSASGDLARTPSG